MVLIFHLSCEGELGTLPRGMDTVDRHSPRIYMIALGLSMHGNLCVHWAL